MPAPITKQPSTPELLVGARGWHHDAWTPEFYPDDLPSDWRLAYYANEFSTVIVPPSYAEWATPEDAGGWRDDVPESFHFYLELPESIVGDRDGLEQRLALAAQLNDRRSTVLFPINSKEWSASPGALDWVRMLSRRQPVCLMVDVPGAVATLGNVLREPNVTLGCKIGQDRGEVDDFVLDPIYPTLAVVSSNWAQPAQLRWLRAVVESMFRVAVASNEVALLFDGTPPAVEDMRNARAIAELL